MLQISKSKRLEREREARLRTRLLSLTELLQTTAADVLDFIPSVKHKTFYIPENIELSKIPTIKSFLENDTDSTADSFWPEVTTDVRTIIAQHWRDFLVNLIEAVLTPGLCAFDAAPEPSECGAVDSGHQEDESTVMAEVAAITDRLSRVTGLFKCYKSCCPQIGSLLETLDHAFQFHNVSPADVPKWLVPITAEEQQLISRLMTDLGMDPDAVIPDELWTMEHLLCARCDKRVAPFSSFNDLVSRFLSVTSTVEEYQPLR